MAQSPLFRHDTAICILLGLVVTTTIIHPVRAADPDIVKDFGIDVTSGSDLHFTGFRHLPEQPSEKVHITFAFDTQFRGVIGLGIAPALLKFGPDSLNSFHTHPRSSEVFYVLEGELQAGVLDTANNLYTATLKKGDVFVFQQGLMHYQINRSKTKPATAIAVFNSENGGRVSIPPAIFNSFPRIETDVLMKALFLNESTIERLKDYPFPSSM